jgi:hypothetical protein
MANKPISSKGVQFSYGTDATCSTKLYSIFSTPEVGGAPEMIDVTTLSDEAQVGMPGLPANDAMEFSGFRGKYGAAGTAEASLVDEYAALRALDPHTMYYQMITWPDGSKDSWQGTLHARPSEAEVNGKLTYKLTSIPATKITTTAASGS